MKNEKILALRVALLKAVANAENVKDTEDGGTCNFDTPGLILKGWKKTEVIEAFLLTGLRPYFGKDYVVEIFDGCTRQGFRRTAMAEAMRDSLKADGYTAFVDYRMD